MTATLLAGLHDREGAVHVPRGGWCVDTVALADKPVGANYAALAPGVNWIGRLNWGYGATGTIPHPHDYEAMAIRAAWFVAESLGCRRWIIGNEPNHSQEWPGGQPITPSEYARCFGLCRQAIKRVQLDAEVIPAPVAPLNAESGDWLEYFSAMLTTIGRDGFDALALHSYIHRADPALVNSPAKMDPPFHDRHFEFRAYQDTLDRVPQFARHLPVYLTEANPLDGWQARGVMPAMLDNVREWNSRADTQRVGSVIFYRYPDYDRWGMASKPDVIHEFRQAAPHYPAPTVPASSTLHLPALAGGGPASPPSPPDRDWDERLTARGVRIETPPLSPGQRYLRVVRGRWLDVAESGGRHHILADVLDEQGARRVGVPLVVRWPGGGVTIATEAKPGEAWAANFPMSPSRDEFSIGPIETGERVTGIGMGADLGGGFNAGEHTSTALVWQLAVHGETQPAPEPTPVRVSVPPLMHPLWPGAPVTQQFGVNPERYARFNLDGHNGVDFGVPVGTPVKAVDDGRVLEVHDDPAGYGKYVKVQHTWGESLFAHLSAQRVAVGATVAAGQVIGLSGNTGYSTGPHLHLGVRVNPYTRGRPFDGYRDPLPLLGGAATPEPPPTPTTDVTRLILEAAREFDVRPALFASLVWAESSYRWWAESSAGAMGLAQVMPATWDEWAAKVGARDPWHPRDSLRLGAAYLAWCIRTAGDQRRGVAAYAWGIGHVQAGGEWPAAVREYANRVTHGADLLDAWGVFVARG